MFRDRSIQGLRKRLLHSSWNSFCYRTALAIAVLFAFEVVRNRDAEACKISPVAASEKQHDEIGTEEVEIVAAGFRAVARVEHRRSFEMTHLWLQLKSVPENAQFVVLESVWGAGPDSLSTMWGRVIPIRNQHVLVYPENVNGYRDQPFTLGLRIRYVFADGSLSDPSLPIFVNHSGSVKSGDGIRVDQVVMGFFCVVLFLFLYAYKRSGNLDGRIRVSALLALASLLFLAVSPALSWMSVEDPNGRYASVDCHLGNEVQCATYAPDSGPNPISQAQVSSERNYEITQWMAASSALRGSLILCLVLLLPGLIWIVLAPRLRVAQGTILLGSSAAGYCFLSALFYRLSMPGWMNVHHYRTLDLTLLTTMTILLSCGLIFFWSFFGRAALEDTTSLPNARVRTL